MKSFLSFLKRMKSPLFAIVPIVAFVLVVHFFFHKFETRTLISFLVGSGIFVVGQVLFLIGIEKSLVPMGEYVGNSSDKMGKFFVILIFGFIFGLFSAIAEPDLQIFANSAITAGFPVPRLLFVFGAGFGTGAFIALALYRLTTKIPINVVIFGFYIIAFVLAIFVSEKNFSIALDTSATTMGVITSPFLLSLGMGVARMKGSASSNRQDNFGLIAISAIGPSLILLILAFVFRNNVVSEVSASSTLPLWLETLKDVSLSLLPLIGVFFVFEIIFIKISNREVKKLILGSLVTFAGFFLYLFSIELGFVGMGEEIGKFLGSVGSVWIAVAVCSVFSFFICFSEPAVKILGKQVEKISNGNIKSSLVVTTIGISIVIAVFLSVFRVFFGISIWFFIIPIFTLAFILSFFASKTFTAIAFDSAGVAAGSLTIAFVFPIMLGMSGDGLLSMAFGVVAICSITPIVVVQIMGILYRINVKIESKREARMLIRFSRTTDKYSNIEALEKRHKEIIGGEKL